MDPALINLFFGGWHCLYTLKSGQFRSLALELSTTKKDRAIITLLSLFDYTLGGGVFCASVWRVCGRVLMISALHWFAALTPRTQKFGLNAYYSLPSLF